MNTVVNDPTDPYERLAQTFPRLSLDQVNRVSRFGQEEVIPPQSKLFERGGRTADFFVVRDQGAIEVFEEDENGREHILDIHLFLASRTQATA